MGRGTAHIWWDYMKVKEYWRNILNNIREVIGQEMPEISLSVLLEKLQVNIRKEPKIFVLHMLTAARLLLAKN